MARDQEEHYVQDRKGDVNREIDPVRGQGGMDLGPEIDGDRYPQGLINYDPSLGREPLYIIPPDVSTVSVSEIHIHNSGDSAGIYSLFEGAYDYTMTELDNLTYRRSVPIKVEPGKTRMMSYTGIEFGQVKNQRSSTNANGYGVIMVDGNSEATVGVGVYNHSPEEKEPASEQAERVPRLPMEPR